MIATYFGTGLGDWIAYAIGFGCAVLFIYAEFLKRRKP
jgi:hypothetical protein